MIFFVVVSASTNRSPGNALKYGLLAEVPSHPLIQFTGSPAFNCSPNLGYLHSLLTQLKFHNKLLGLLCLYPYNLITLPTPLG